MNRFIQSRHMGRTSQVKGVDIVKENLLRQNEILNILCLKSKIKTSNSWFNGCREHEITYQTFRRELYSRRFFMKCIITAVLMEMQSFYDKEGSKNHQ